jgi:hypothetical protein
MWGRVVGSCKKRRRGVDSGEGGVVLFVWRTLDGAREPQVIRGRPRTTPEEMAKQARMRSLSQCLPEKRCQ